MKQEWSTSARLTTNNIDLLLICFGPSGGDSGGCQDPGAHQNPAQHQEKGRFLVNQAEENQEADIQKSARSSGLNFGNYPG